MEKIKGLIAATYAPLDDNGNINTIIIKDYTYFLISNAVSGAFINGSTGDFTSLSTKERKQITLAWSQAKSKDLYLIDHVGHTNLREAKELAMYAADKVDAIAAIAPFYFKLTNIDKLVTYCKEIAASAPNLPFFYYHIPVLSGANFTMDAFLKKAKNQIPNLAGVKFTNNNLIDYQHSKKVANGKYNLLFGFDELFLNSLPVGATGWVGSTYNQIAPLYLKIKESFEQGNMKKAAELQYKAIRFVEILDSKGGYNGVAKSFMKKLGLNCGASRFPHNTLNDYELNEVYSLLQKESIADYVCTFKPEKVTG